LTNYGHNLDIVGVGHNAEGAAGPKVSLHKSLLLSAHFMYQFQNKVMGVKHIWYN